MASAIRFSITLSEKTADMLGALREETDATSDSEVFRNAIRLAFSVMEAQKAGYDVAIKNKEGNAAPLSVLTAMPHVVSSEKI